jgi:hypothetical protein
MSTVSLSIDYSNGVQKHFSSISWKEDLTIMGAVEASMKIPPGTTVKFGSDRAGRVLGLVIDEMPGTDTPALDWVVSINAKRFEHRLGTETSFGFFPAERPANLLRPGDHVLLKLDVKTDL